MLSCIITQKRSLKNLEVFFFFFFLIDSPSPTHMNMFINVRMHSTFRNRIIYIQQNGMTGNGCVPNTNIWVNTNSWSFRTFKRTVLWCLRTCAIFQKYYITRNILKIQNERQNCTECQNTKTKSLIHKVGGVFDISNADRLGFSEVELVVDGVKLLVDMEKCLEAGQSLDDLMPEQKWTLLYDPTIIPNWLLLPSAALFSSKPVMLTTSRSSLCPC